MPKNQASFSPMKSTAVDKEKLYSQPLPIIVPVNYASRSTDFVLGDYQSGFWIKMYLQLTYGVLMMPLTYKKVGHSICRMAVISPNERY